ncbi:DUF2062 domain-containing protein [Edaphobacter albus]|uniref:DUF2062 domain-containing protein n=1 Tax=Edaphobacter sp. 4G125 TaxID=2763071 RepID=UPI001646850A|nr:DUF2062 domain-containing protein [Edaphobacter sp. 4G125]QNI38303.1 DUF2062 domain-containing protein [Edaphobacter sp. 4G125]
MDTPSLKEGNAPNISADPSENRSLLYRRIILPILALLRRGASPRRLAWSIAVGLLIGINPLLGTTTILCFAAAIALRLNIAASQLANHMVYPLQLLLLVPFLELGSYAFHTKPLPFSSKALLEAIRKDPIEFGRRIWRWEWHAFLVWATIAAVLVPLIALILTPVLRKLSTRLQRSKNNIEDDRFLQS